jgi:N6-adenosine-specific RNA methylase IME4
MPMAQPTPTPGFRTILADPPWDVMQRGNRGAEQHYSLMTVEEIAALPVRELASVNAHLWLWVTNATLFSGQVVMTAWGFAYRSCLTWESLA